MEDWGDWKPGLPNTPTHGVVLAVLTGTTYPVHGTTPTRKGLSPWAVTTAKVSTRGDEGCPEPVTGGPAVGPWPISHPKTTRPDQQSLVGQAGGMEELIDIISLSEASVETSRATTPSAGSDKVGEIAAKVKIVPLVNLSGKNESRDFESRVLGAPSHKVDPDGDVSGNIPPPGTGGPAGRSLGGDHLWRPAARPGATQRPRRLASLCSVPSTGRNYNCHSINVH